MLHKSDDKTDAYVVCVCPGISKTSEQKTKVVMDSLDPKWNQSFTFPLVTSIENNMNANLVLRVRDSDTTKDDEVGAYTLNLQQVAVSKMFDDWVTLFDSSNKDTGGKLHVRVKYSPPPKAAAPASGSVVAGIAGVAESVAGKLGELEGGAPAAPGVPLMAGPKPVPKGEWVLRLTVFEARGLQSESLDCLDPVCKIRAGSMKRTTNVVKNTLNPTFDEDFTIKFTGNDPNTFWDQQLQLDIFHSKVFADARIGSFTFEFGAIYDQPGHEYFRRWLVIQKGDGDVAVMGYLLVSVALLGPADEPVTHDEVLVETDTLSNCLYPKDTPFQTIDLMITVYRAEDIPQMDFSFTTGINAIDRFTGQKDKQCADPFVVISYGGNSVQTITIPQSQYPEFYQVLHLPMIIPSMSREIRVRMLDYDVLTENDTIGTACLDMDELTQGGTRMPRLDPTWLNMYGAPRQFALTPPIHLMKYYERMNKGLIPGSTYRGRVLISIEGKLNTKSAGNQMMRVPNESPPMPMAMSTLTVEMMWGCMLPSGKLRVIASWGDQNVSTTMIKAKVPYDQPQVTNPHRSVDWNEKLDLSAVWEVQGMPDLTLTLMDDTERLGFARMPVAQLSGKGPVESTLFLTPDADPEDAVDTVTGLLGFRVKLVVSEPKTQQRRLGPNPPPKKDIAITQGIPMTVQGAKQVTVRAHIFKARKLMAGDDNGLADPYFRIVFGSGCGQTTFLCNTLNPNINELVAFDADVFQPFPPLVVEAWDRDMIGKDTYLGRFMMPLSITTSVQPLQWYKLDKGGDVLASFELVPRGTPAKSGAPTSRNRINPPPFVNATFNALPIDASITPKTYSAVIDAEILGLRNMATYMMLDIKDALVEFSVDEVAVCTRRVRGLNANFLQRVQLNVELPEDVSFVPELCVKVFDHRFFGQRVLVGNTSIDLQRLLDPVRSRDLINDNDEEEDVEDHAHLHKSDDFDESISLKDTVMKNRSASMPTSPANVQVSFPSYGSLDQGAGPVVEADDDDTISKWLKMYFKGQIPRYPTPLEKQIGGFNDRYPLYPLKRGMKSKVIGGWKGSVDIRRTSEPPSSTTLAILKETNVIVRVYVLRASSLIPHDTAITGGKNDPFLKVSLGSGLSSGGKVTHIQTTEDRVIFGTLNPEFMESFEFDVSIPTVNELQVAVWDYDSIGSNELIGYTMIDLDDRWFTLKRDLIPVERHTERRNLIHPEQSGNTAQGRIEMWVDIFDKSKPLPPKVDIHLPSNEGFELRVIVWNVANCILQEEASLTGEMMTDIYVKCFLEGKRSDAQDTDVHYRSLDGTGAFNWRMKFPLMYVRRDKGIILNLDNPSSFKLFSTRQTQKPVKPNLIVQLWDNDTISADDFIGEVKVPLDKRVPEGQNSGVFVPVTALNTQPLNLFGKVKDPDQPTLKKVNGIQQTPKIWYTIPGKDGKKVGEVQLSFQLVPLADVEKPDFLAGKGRSEPNANPMLPPPERPASSFFFLTSPLKTMYYVIWKNYKKWIIGIVCVALLVLLLYGFGVYTVQVGTYKMWGVNLGSA
jgi:hypothetical protein